MATEKWSGSLGHVAERLRRALGWTSAGPLPVEFANPSQLMPVAIADDSTRPGANAYSERNRRWMWPNGHEDVPMGDTPWVAVGADLLGKGLIIDRIQFSVEAQSTFYIQIIPPGLVGTGHYPTWIDAAINAVQRGPLFVEGNRGITDFAPALQASSANAVVSGAGQLIWGLGVGDSAGGDGDIGRIVTIPLEIYLQPGAWLAVSPGDAEIADFDWQCVFFGRTF